jgi:hypothetical protein
MHTQRFPSLLLLARKNNIFNNNKLNPIIQSLHSFTNIGRLVHDFNNKNISYKTRYGVVIVPQGERCAVQSLTGSMSLIDGPKLMLGMGRRFSSPLDRLIASSGEYISIHFHDGSTKIMPGPNQVIMDPINMDSIELYTGLEILANELVVIYREDSNNNTNNSNAGLTRHVIHGPSVYVPQSPLEITHTFSWHGDTINTPPSRLTSSSTTTTPNPANDTLTKATSTGNANLYEPLHTKTPNALRFQKLRTTPAQLYYDVVAVRTKDDALIRVRLMIFYHLDGGNVEKLIDRTSDPIADLINAVSADVISFASARTFETFKEESNQLNSLESFPKLVKIGEEIGFKITGIVNRGFISASSLQEMHDRAIETRTRLVLERETEQQRAELAAFKLIKDRERAEAEMSLEKDRAEHNARLLAAQNEAKLFVEKKEYENSIQWAAELKNVGVDVTPVLVAKETKVGANALVMRVEKGGK